MRVLWLVAAVLAAYAHAQQAEFTIETYTGTTPPVHGTLPPMSVGGARRRHTMSLTAAGNVLVVGGIDAGGVKCITGQLFDQASGTWGPSLALQDPRLSHTTTMLNDGRLLSVGGYGSPPSLSAVVTSEYYHEAGTNFT
jgi:hypothetical protein